jgi:hypothetical protein
MKFSQPLLDFTTAPVAPQTVTMAPSAIQSRRSGVRAARAKATPQMVEYRALLERAPITDQEAARALGWYVSTVNARRGDWLEALPGCIGARGRVSVTHPNGRKSSRTLWVWCGKHELVGDHAAVSA